MIPAPEVKNSLTRLLLMTICLICALNLTACGGISKNSNKNTISPYDPEFDPDEDDSARNEKILDADQQLPLLLEALELYDDELYSSAKETLATLQRQFPSSYYAPLVELKLADSNYFLGEYSAAIESYEEFLRLRPRHEAAAYARLQIANSHFAQYRGVVFDQTPLTQAEAEYQKVITEFPNSSVATQAKSRLETCAELRKEHAAYVARFYHKRGLADASVNRAKKLLSDVSLEESREVLGSELFKNVQDSISEAELRDIRIQREQNKRAKLSKDNERLKEELTGHTSMPKRSMPNSGLGSFPDEDFGLSQARPLLYACYKQDNSTLMEIQLPASVELQEQTPGFEGEWKLLLDLPGVKTKQKKNFELVLANENLACEKKDLTAKLETTSANQLAVSLKSRKHQEATALMLDRPNRLLILLK